MGIFTSLARPQESTDAFLTEKPLPISGFESNEVSKGSDSVFRTDLTLAELDRSRAARSTPSFFKEKLAGLTSYVRRQPEPLNDTEQAELRDFLTKYTTSEPVTVVDDKVQRGFVK